MSLDIELTNRNGISAGDFLVLFIHGLGAPDTWDNSNSDWKKLIISDNELDSVDVGLVRYNTAHLFSGIFRISGTFKLLGREMTVSSERLVTIDELAKHLKTKLSVNRFRKYKKIFIVGHSMGGLVGMRYILNEYEHQKDVSKIGGFISYATPFNGSSVADFHKLIKKHHKHPQIPQLEPNCEFLDNLIRTYNDYEEVLRQQIIFNFCYGDIDPVVKKESAVPHTKRSHTYVQGQTLGGDHGSVLDTPDGIYTTNYEILQSLILDVINTTEPPHFPIGNQGDDLSQNKREDVVNSSNQTSNQIVKQIEGYRNILEKQFITRFPSDSHAELLNSMNIVINKLKLMNSSQLERFLSLYHYSSYENEVHNQGYQELWELLTLINVIYPNWNFIDPNELFQLPNLKIEDSKWVRVLYSLQKETMPEIVISFLSRLFSGAFRDFIVRGNYNNIFPYRFILENVNNESLIPNTDENICEVCKGKKADFSKILTQFGQADNLSVFQGLEPNYIAKEVSVLCTSCIRQARKEKTFDEVCNKLKRVI